MVTSKQLWEDFTCIDSDGLSYQFKRTVEEMTPGDVEKRKEGRVQQLRNDIERYKEYIVAARAEIKAWENI